MARADTIQYDTSLSDEATPELIASWPLSIYQREVYLDQAFHPTSPVYNIGYYWVMRAGLQVDRLEQALRHVFEASEITRVQLDLQAEEPRVLLRRHSRVPLEHRHRDVSVDGPQALASEVASIEREAFSLGAAALMQVIFIHYVDATVMVLKAHHILVDGRGLQTLSDAVVSVYNALVRGQLPEIPADVRTGHREIADQEVHYEGSARHAKDVAFFRAELESVEPGLSEGAAASLAQRPGARESFSMPAAVLDEIRAWAQHSGTTVFQYLVAVLVCYLGQSLSRRSLVLGLPVLNRRAGHARTIGLFANVLAIRFDVSPEHSFGDLLQSVGGKVRRAFRHQQLPLGHVIRIWQELGHAGLPFDVKLSYEPYTIDLALEGCEIELGYLTNHEQNHPVSLFVRDVSTISETEFNLDYLPEVLAQSISAADLARGFLSVLQAAWRAPEATCAALCALPDRSREEVLALSRGPRFPHPVERTLVDMLEARADATPAKTAVVFAGTTLSFGELDGRANQVAQWLRGEGFGPGDVIGVRAYRSLDLLVAIYGVVKAGAAYLPLDPAHPEVRLSAIAADAACRCVLLGGGAARHVAPVALEIDVKDPVIARQSRQRPRALLSPDDLAYVIYTSGSTGRPKGVMITHRAILHRLLWQQRALPIAAGDTLLHKTPYGFDVSVWELFWGALSGARLVIAPAHAEKRPDELFDLVRRYGVGAVHFVPSMLGAALDYLEQRPDSDDALASLELASLRYVICSGEALTPSLVRRFYAQLSKHGASARLINLYGPTEASVDVTCFECTPQDGERARLPIGRPIDNTGTYVMTGSGQLAAPGAVGELCLGGPQLARGYLGDDCRTEQAFVWNGDLAERIYHTGDLARWNQRGELEYLGRRDHQVKVRGHRVELGEIEACLGRVAEISECVVVALGSEDNRRLCAYYVAREACDPAWLRVQLCALLPPYMVPAHFVRLSAWPVSENGKLDRSALPEPTLGAEASDGYLPAETAIEAELVGLFGEVLGRDHISVTDNYFSLGGDSLRVIKLQARARRLGFPCDLADIYAHPTPRALAAHLQQRGIVPVPPPEEPVLPFSMVAATGSESNIESSWKQKFEDVFPATDLQVGMIYHSRRTPESSVYHDIFHYQLELPWDAQAFARAVARLVERHPALRMSFDLGHETEPLARIHRSVAPALQIAAPRTVSAGDVDAYIARRRAHRYVWERAPLWELAVFPGEATDDARQRVDLVFSFHHAILDGWSVATLLRDLVLLHENETRSVGHRLPVLSSTPAAFSRLERRAAADDASRAFWRSYLADAEATPLTSWSAYAQPSEASAEPRVLWDVLPEPLVTRAVQRARELGLPIKSLYFTAHCAAVAAMSGEYEILTGLVTNGRSESEDAEHVTGLFLSTLPVRYRSRGRSWAECSRRLLEAERAAYRRRRFPVSQMTCGRPGEPVLSTAFNYTNFRVLEDLASSSSVRLLAWNPHEVTDFPLLASVARDWNADAIRLKVDFDPKVLPAAQARTYIDSFRAALHALTDAPDAQAVLADAWPEPLVARAGRDATSLVSLFRARVNTAPERVALRAGSDTLSYRALAERASGVAQGLVALGASGGRVGIMMQRSLDQIVSVLGVLEAGAACVPLDRSYPDERLAFMLQDAQLTCLLTDDASRATCARLFPHGQVVDVASLSTRAAVPPSAALPPVAADAPAYILFTSGSTGRPKGVTMAHRGLVNLVLWQAQDTPLGSGARTLQYAPISFDVAFQEIFATLCSGGELVLIDESLRADFPALLRLLRKGQVERLFLPYAALQAIAHVAATLDLHPAALRYVIVAGEQLRLTDQIRSLFACMPATELHNQYGPTESHVVTRARLSGAPARWPRLAPIGTPIAHAQVHVLDAQRQPVFGGTPGELYLEGECLAEGYFGRPDLTAERFVEVAVGSRCRRLYRTGDVGIRRPDGELLYLGRGDAQIKVRGFRVELHDVETNLLRIAGPATLKQAAVVPLPDADGNVYLAALVVPVDPDLDLVQLRDALRTALPEHMLPRTITALPALPVGATGKIDRKALLELAQPAPAAVRGVPPRSATERRLSVLWCSVLGISQVWVEDDFFALGGDSLKAVRAVSMLERDLDLSIPLSTFVERPVLADFARELDLRLTDRVQPRVRDLVDFGGSEGAPRLFMVHPIGGNVLCYTGLARQLRKRVHLYGLQAPGVADERQPLTSVVGLARHYADLIEEACPAGELNVGGWSFGGFVATALATELRGRGRRVRHTFVLDSIMLRKRQALEVEERALFQWFVWELLAGDWQGDIESFDEELHGEPNTAHYTRVLERAVARGLLPAGQSASVVARLFQVFKANWQALLAFEPDPLPRLTLFSAQGALPTQLRGAHDLVESAYDDPLRGWGKFVRRIEYVAIAGDHLSMMRSPCVEQIAEFILESFALTLSADEAGVAA